MSARGARRRHMAPQLSLQSTHPALLLSRPLISYLRKFYYYDPEEEIHPSLTEQGAEPSAQLVIQPQT